MAIEIATVDAAKVTEIRKALEMMVQWVVPRLMALDLEWYVQVTERLAGRTRQGLPESSMVQDAMVGTVDAIHELARAALDFQRACRHIFPEGERRFAPGGARVVRP